MSTPGEQSRLRRTLPPTVAILVVVAVWWAVTAWFGVPKYLIPAPQDVIVALGRYWGTLWSATVVTGSETLLGLLAGVIAAAIISVTVYAVKPLRSALEPLLIGTQTVPVMVFAPILTIALGYGIASKIVIVALLCFFPVTVSLLAGLQGVDPRLIDTMRTLWASPGGLFWRVRMPFALPQGFAGLRISVTFAPVAAVFGEYAGSSNGLGYHLIQAIPRLRTDFVFAEVVLLTAMTAALYLLTLLAERLVCGWQRDRLR
ncbi:ABC transporter permease [Pseudoclavibacter sp. 13-3]|uniref:ABC transporter permease n=1 Tax=Pseudoclavibacter sp. 13-3 TaxID=2901228 RepID=UPI001E62EE38|nr:ABC transporter permease [Pseudoclavibacter sp. 13-3]MCD7100640.1 ABC transporter permease [Pseudoclavibacter sp. 13-3]